ncbi:hypothetical protein [Streptomyces diastaticus]|uniref:hypothetical protein n=1 Tax=Streptomyces diastaticus TaxID=1956 RepID=UPI003D1781B2
MGWCDFWEDLPGPPPPACSAKDAAGDAIADAAASAWESVVQDFQSAALYTAKEVGLSWLTVDSPVLSNSTGPTGFVIGSTFALTQWLAVLSLLLAAGHMAWTQRTDPARQVVGSMVRLALVSSAAVAVVNLLTAAGDGYSGWVVGRGLGCSNPDAKACTDQFVQQMRDMTSLAEEDQLALTLVLSLIMLISGLVQLLMVIVRDSMLIILTGILPLAAAISGSERGREWWQRIVNALLVALLWAPVASTIYGAAFVAYGGGNGADDPSLLDQLYGVVLMVLAALSMPLLWRTMGPVSGALIGGGAGGGAGGVGSRVASGAMMIKGGGVARGAAAAGTGAKGGGKNGGNGGDSGPSGGKTTGSGGGPAGTGGTPGTGSGGGKGGPTGGQGGGKASSSAGTGGSTQTGAAKSGPTGGGPSTGSTTGGKAGSTSPAGGGPSGGKAGPVPAARRNRANTNQSGGGPRGSK